MGWTMRITKLRAAERQIISAVRLLFDGDNAVSVYALAAAAREVTTALCEKRHTPSYFDLVQKQYPSLPRKEMYRLAHRHARFFKHADTDPERTLTGFEADEADSVLFIATFDFGKLCGGKPVEAQVFEAWFLTIHLAPADVLPRLNDLFPNLRKMGRANQLRLGRAVLEWARNVPEFHMTYSTAARAKKRRRQVARQRKSAA
jgi:hypothetical protein